MIALTENFAVDNSSDTAPIAIIMRRDSAGNPVCFLLGSLDLSVEGGSIEVWHVGHQRDTSKVPLSYYHSTTALSDHEEKDLANKFASGYMPKFGISQRKRLYKSAEQHHSHPAKSANDSLRRSGDSKQETFDKVLYVQKLQLALETSLRAAFKIVNEEFGIK